MRTRSFDERGREICGLNTIDVDIRQERIETDEGEGNTSGVLVGLDLEVEVMLAHPITEHVKHLRGVLEALGEVPRVFQMI